LIHYVVTIEVKKVAVQDRTATFLVLAYLLRVLVSGIEKYIDVDSEGGEGKI
jgi:hypothetical protein